MIRVKSIIKVDETETVEKTDLAKIHGGKCSYSGGGLSFDCDSFHAHVGTSSSVHADNLHVNY